MPKHRLTPARRRALEEQAKQIRLQGQLEGWARDRTVDEILARLPEILPLEAHRLAYGWTRLELSRALDSVYQRDGLMAPGVGVSEICGWEHGRHQPNGERQDYLTRLYQTRPDRLGFGRDYSAARSPAVGPEAPDGQVLSVFAGGGTRIVSVRCGMTAGGQAEVVFELEDSDADRLTAFRLVGSLAAGTLKLVDDRVSARAGSR